MQVSTLTLAFCLAALPAAAQQIDDPANLMGERVSAPALADTLPINHGAPALEQLLRKLRTRASMMLIVAHPDDEDSGLLTYESRGMGARVAMLTLTRGEGGQNLMSADFNDALGLIRTQELLAEDRYTGTDQFFGTEVDFGFSKTKEETLKQWGHDRVLYDAVRAVRLYRPLVLASVFVGGPTDGHGQHQVSGEISQEVFLAAADPKVFPEMGLPAWAPLRVYARVPFSRVGADGMFDYATGRTIPTSFHNYVTGATTHTPPEVSVTVHEGDKPGILAFNNLSYVQWARQGLALQKSQIGANFRIPPAGVADVGYTLMASRKTCPDPRKGCPIQSAAASRNEWASARPAGSAQQEDLFTGIDTSLPSIANLAPHASDTVKVVLKVNLEGLGQHIAEAQAQFDPVHTESVVPILHEELVAFDSFLRNVEEMKPALLPPDEKFNVLHELRIKRVQLNDALVLALGISMTAQAQIKSDAHLDRSVAIVGGDLSPLTEPFEVSISLKAAPGQHISVLDMEVDRAPTSMKPPRPLEAVHSIRVTASLQNSFGVSRPYFSRDTLEKPFYNIARPSLRNAPSTPALAINARLSFDGVPLDVSRTIESGGTLLELVPPVSIAVSPSVQVRPETAPPLPIFVDVTSQSKQELNGTLRPGVPDSWSSQPIDFQLNLKPQLQEARTSFQLQSRRTIPGQSYSVSAVVNLGREAGAWGETYRAVGYPGLTSTNYYTPAVSRIVPVDVTTAPNLHIAYLPGTGDEVAQFLPSLGVTPTMITPKDLGNLSQYDAVILGVRAYSAHPELEGAGSQPLLDYAKAGGIVIAQYNSAGFDPASAPFPYTLPGDSAHNVVDEDQPVSLLQPENPLLRWPNRMTSHDFDHWIEERGHGFASDWAPEYTPLLETHDPEQDPQKGGLFVARTGKGAYIYCALALYRQLPEGVPGAYRLMANLLSYAKNPGRH